MKTNIGIGTAAGLLVLAGGCATSPQGDGVEAACAADCSITVQLPRDDREPPSAPDTFRVQEGASVRFDVASGKNTQTRNHRMILAFGQAAFVDGDNPVYTLELNEPGQQYRARSYEDGVCRPPAGCRYVLINAGNPWRPAVIGSPRIIIDPR